MPAAAAELGAGPGFYAIHRPVCFHLLQFLVLRLEMPAWDHEQKTTKCAFSVCHIHLLELIFETLIMCKHVCPQSQEEDSRLPPAGITGGGELPNMGAGS